MQQLRWWIEFGHFPAGDPSSSPGLLYSATLGKTAAGCPTPTGLRPCLQSQAHEHNNRERFEATSSRLGTRRGLATTPLGLRNSLAVFPRVAEYSNPGLKDGTPFGEMSKP